MINPSGHRVLVKPDEIKTETASGILLVTDANKRQEAQAQIFGKIVSIGPNAWKAFDDGQPWAKVGDHVAFAKYGGFVIKDPYTEEEFRLLNDEDICAVVKE